MTLEQINEWGKMQSAFVKDQAPVKRARPASTGDIAPFFALTETTNGWQASDLSGGFANSTTLPQLLDQGPVVISFYCPCWGSYAQSFLDTLISLSAPIQAVGGRLVVFSNENPRHFSPELSDSPMLLAYDADYTVARQFGVYSEYDLIWDRVEGISVDAYVPALYVIGGSRRITYRFLDENFEGFAQTINLFKALL